MFILVEKTRFILYIMSTPGLQLKFAITTRLSASLNKDLARKYHEVGINTTGKELDELAIDMINPNAELVNPSPFEDDLERIEEISEQLDDQKMEWLYNVHREIEAEYAYRSDLLNPNQIIRQINYVLKHYQDEYDYQITEKVDKDIINERVIILEPRGSQYYFLLSTHSMYLANKVYNDDHVSIPCYSTVVMMLKY